MHYTRIPEKSNTFFKKYLHYNITLFRLFSDLSEIDKWELFALTPHSGFNASINYGFYNPKLRLVKITFNMYGSTASYADVVATIPAKYRPTSNTGYVLGSLHQTTNNQFDPCQYQIKANGDILQTDIGSGNYDVAIINGFYII